MAASKVSICNGALIKIGVDPIDSISEDTRQAEVLNRIYDNKLDYVLNKHDWDFAIKRDTLAQSTTVPEYEYTYCYQLPTDCIYIIDVYEDDDWKVEGNFILSDEETCQIKYIYARPSEAYLSPIFCEALEFYIAASVCNLLTDDKGSYDRMMDGYNKVIKDAKWRDSLQKATKYMKEPTVITVR